MENKIVQQTMLWFRICLFIWIVIANIIIYSLGIEYGWLIFISNVVLFTIDGNIKTKLLSTLLGGFTGLCLSALMIYAMVFTESYFGAFWSYVLPLMAVMFIMIVLQPRFPMFLNSSSFAYLVCSCINAEIYATNLKIHFATFALGATIFNTVSVLLLIACNKIAKSKVTHGEIN